MRASGPVRVTPLIPWPGRDLWVKLENLQHTGSFKLRGAWTKLSRMSPTARERGVVAASAGNHGAGVALAARNLGCAARIVVPEGTPANKRDRMIALGAELHVFGAGYDEADAHARDLAHRVGAPFVSPYDDDDVIAGNGEWLARELLDQDPGVQRVVAPVGGGGLIGGLAKILSPRGVAVIGAQPAANCAMAESIAAGRALTAYRGRPTVAEGCEGAVAERTFELVRRHAVPMLRVEEAAIESAVARVYHELGQIIECSAAVAVAAAEGLAAGPRTIIIASGGNIDADRLDAILRT